MSLYLGNTVISGVTTPIDGSIAIGQVISSIIPLTDAGLHLLDGSVIQGGGIYDNFVQYIADLVNIYPQCFTDETTWQNTVSSKGACGKFVYDSTNNTVRLPKITGFIEGTVNSNALGELVEAGLPNITGITGGQYIRNGYEDAQGAGALVNSNTIPATIAPGDGWWATQLNFDASQSNSIYGNSTTVQPQSIKVFYYIVIATTTKTDIEVDIDEVSSDLNTITGQITNISSTLSTKANDNDVVHLTGNENISGVKTFTDYITALRFEGNNNINNNIDFMHPSKDGGWFLNADRLDNSSWYEIMTTYHFQVVSTLPASPDSNVFYFIPE